jgi:hypothetical protein
LGIGDHHELAVPFLQADARSERAHIVTQVELAGRAVAGEDDFLFIHGNILLKNFLNHNSLAAIQNLWD